MSTKKSPAGSGSSRDKASMHRVTLLKVPHGLIDLVAEVLRHGDATLERGPSWYVAKHDHLWLLSPWAQADPPWCQVDPESEGQTNQGDAFHLLPKIFSRLREDPKNRCIIYLERGLPGDDGSELDELCRMERH